MTDHENETTVTRIISEKERGQREEEESIINWLTVAVW